MGWYGVKSVAVLVNSKINVEDYEGAVSDHTKAIEINPSYAKAYYHRAAAKENLDDLEGMITDLKKAKELGSEEANKYLKLIEDSLSE